MSRAALRARRVLVVAFCFPPHGAIGTLRTLRVVRRLHETGWDISVLTCDPAEYLPGTPLDAALSVQVPPTVRIIPTHALRPWLRLQRVLLKRNRPTASSALAVGIGDNGQGTRPHGVASRSRLISGLARAKDLVDATLAIPDRESGWILPTLARGVVDHLREARPDVIYSSAPPWSGQLVAAGLKQFLGCPWVADFRDPWARAPWREDRYGFAMRAAARLERFVINRADRVVFTTTANAADFAAQYGTAAAARFDVVANGCNPAEFDALRAITPDAAAPFVLLHSGSLYAGRTPEPLFKAAALAISRGDIDPTRFRIRFLGANALRNTDLTALCRQLGLEDVVEFLPRVVRDESVRAMMSASALLLLQPGHTASIPGKLYEYLAAARPILAIAEEGETSALVRRGGGLSVLPGDERAIADSLAAIVRGGRDTLNPAPRNLWDGNIGAASIVDILSASIRPGQATNLRTLEGQAR
jgi:glycosyltransferase involved in cell wall biosynthesis